MHMIQDRQVRHFCSFLLLFSVLAAALFSLFCFFQLHTAREMYLFHSQAAASALLEQGVPETVIAAALTGSAVSPEGEALLNKIGFGESSSSWLLPFLNSFLRENLIFLAGLLLLLGLLLFLGTILFFRSRRRLYLQAGQIIQSYTDGDFSAHLPQNQEGELFRLFASVEQLATILQSKNETEHKTKEFLKTTISDISHQLKTPLAALAMYQEILADEPDNADAVREFSGKMGAALTRMEQLILSMLKITCLDTGNIVFEQKAHPLPELISRSLSDLTERARQEGKELLINGDPEAALYCDAGWTSEAIGNLVKNALDHTDAGGHIQISWKHTPAMLQITVADDGSGIAPEDIHHIFKRFYRSSRSLDTTGVGLGLPLAKSIIEGQGGLISVQSTPGEGTAFTLSFLTKP